tara:strand:- start:742 stop:1194 length:453 start_codon:yes stop_codon:yes gene_type:complete
MFDALISRSLQIFILFIYCSIHASDFSCPTHDTLKSKAQLDSIEYTHSHANMYFKLESNHQNLSLSFRLPGQAPFARPASSHYASDSESFNRGDINWGFTNHYRTDFASTLMKYIVYKAAYPTDTMVDCVYLSTLEGYFIYGHIWMHRAS